MRDERELSPEKIDKVKKMRANGFTMREIQRALQVSPKTVLKYAPDEEIVKVETALVPSESWIPKDLIEVCAKHGLTPVLEERTRRIYFKRLE